MAGVNVGIEPPHGFTSIRPGLLKKGFSHVYNLLGGAFVSAAAPAPRYTPGPLEATVKSYNTLVEHQSLLTPAEFRLGLCIVRRGGHREGVTISDKTWREWTGLDPRSKEMAARGLQKKCFHVNGRGQMAKYSFDGQMWLDFAGQAPKHRPRTEGRRVDPKTAQKIHPDCRERGCQMLDADSNAKPVSRNGVVESGSSCQGSKRLSIVPAIQNAKRVSQNSLESVGVMWASTLAALQSIFPLVGLAFLARLVVVVSALFADLTDTELAQAVGFAWRQKKAGQKSEGLFLLTVPEAVGALRRARLPAGKGRPPDTIADVLERARDVIGARGADFERHAAAIDSLREQWQRQDFDFAHFEAELVATEFAIFNTASELLTPDQWAEVKASSAGELRATFELLGLPRIGI